jgi:condensin complex subunit 3
MIRVQVVLALSKLAVSEDPSEVGKGEQTLLQVLIDTLSSDPSPYDLHILDVLCFDLLFFFHSEVRRATLVNIPVNSTSLPAILVRARDTETTIRKLLYSSVLDGAASDRTAAHPRTLTIAQRELLVRHGLGDREKTVRAAAATMIGTWIDVIGEKAKPEEELASRITDIDISKTEEKPPVTSEERHQNIIKTLTGFLHMFDLQLVCDGELQGKLASDALTSVFDTRPDIFEDLSFGGEYVSFLLLGS